ncbi:MAG: esterase [marine bacterium B5-7]|nr:MAG: esterase [marine bacterium B5-7]
MLTRGGHRIDYQESGEGPAILFVPGSFSTPMAWRGVQKHLPPHYRFVGTSLCGYGETEETRTLDDLGMHHQTRVIEAVAEKINAPVHLVGHSFGGTIALATALCGNIDVLSIATFEANPLAVMRERSQTGLYETTRRMSEEFESAYRAGERDAAKRIIDFWGGKYSFRNMPEAVQEYCRASTYANVLDWRTAFRFEASMADYAGLNTPVLLVRGASANAAMVEITDALSDSLDNCRTAIVDGASHFLITTHARECARLLSDFFAGITGEADVDGR